MALQTLPIPIGQIRKQVAESSSRMSIKDATYPEYNLSVPIDHFKDDSRYEPHSDDTFPLRYWFDAQFYEPGGPVFVLSGGETSGADRLPFLEKGIVYEIAKATKGLGVILEHRYYGSSIPTPDFSTENLRFLTTEQALADTAYFAQNVKFEGVDADLSPTAAPWIAYGGSYAGSFVAFLRVAYPDVFFGAVSSSGVPEAIWDYWQYFEAARLFAPGECSNVTGKVVHVVDSILLDDAHADLKGQLKDVFGMSGVTDDKDFASGIAGGIYELQSYNWDPELSSDGFFRYCDAVQQTTNQYPGLEGKRDAVKELVTAAGYEGDELNILTEQMLNYIGTLGRSLAACTGDQNECFGTSDVHLLADDDLSQTWRLWAYQVCTEWGFLQTGSGAPDDILPMISRAVDLEYSSRQCREAFDLTEPANTDLVNKYGGHDIAYDRLAFVDGEWDPWRAAGVHAVGLPERESTTSRPMILIDDAVHHWDENGITDDQVTPDFPPPAVKEAKDQIREFILEWLKEWKA
ncbi:hypothetical protein N3K66_007978 [Trichothecium roseum]|uniref:Uncharacterized protein n=1 Tax=Trichothecium roseum TaxID=47278 RepID=A0ACC0UTH7_9HYPO|nr:hypothetical protein N3K66_007978 [Trichothecium roseum]